MGNYKLRLSDLIPNAWFYKLKEMKAKGKARDSNNNSSKKKPKESPPPPSSSSRAPTTLINPSKSPKQVPQSTAHNPRKTYYFSRELLKDDNLNLLPDQPRKSSKHTTRRRPSTVSPKRVSSAGCSCRTTIRDKTVGNSPPILSSPDEGSTITTEETEAANSLVYRPELIRSDRLLVTHSSGQMLSTSTRHREKTESDSTNDIVIDVKPPLPEIALSPIVTKQVIQVEERRFLADTRLKSKLVGVRTAEEKTYNKKERGNPTPSRIKQRTGSNSSSHSPGIRLRINSPRIAGRRSFQQVQGRRSLSSSGSSRSSSSSSRRSLAVVKSSVDPQRDFRESMVEMIVENNLRRSKDLEELLACYLSLNADEYHDLIIKVFKQIWFDLTHRANT